MDNFAASKNLESGSSKPELQTKAMKKKIKKRNNEKKEAFHVCK